MAYELDPYIEQDGKQAWRVYIPTNNPQVKPNILANAGFK
jgi:hypothetical protein